jgi:hypothetical protein
VWTGRVRLTTDDHGTAAAVDAKCASEPLQATETGVTADTITVQVMADTGSALAPGLFQGTSTC